MEVPRTSVGEAASLGANGPPVDDPFAHWGAGVEPTLLEPPAPRQQKVWTEPLKNPSKWDEPDRSLPATTYFPSEKIPGWPTKADIEAFKAANMSYGDTNAGLMNKGMKLWQFQTAKGAKTYLDQRLQNKSGEAAFKVKFDKLSDEQREKLVESYVAVQTNPVGKLGFDIRQIVTNMDNKSSKSRLAGLYNPTTIVDVEMPDYKGKDRLWYDPRYPDTPVHESIHRGLDKLRRSGAMRGEPWLARLQYDDDLDEIITRALVIKHHGTIEKKLGGPQYAEAEIMFKSEQGQKMMERLEELAAEQIKKEKPRGPR